LGILHRVDARITQLVGEVTEEQLRYVEVFQCSQLGLFVPVLGQCGYAIQQDHTHPSWMVLVSATDVPLVGMPTQAAQPGYHLRILAPGIPHQERASAEPNRYYALVVLPEFFEQVALELGIDTRPFAWEPYPASDRLLALIRDLMREHDLKSRIGVLDALSLLVVHELLRCTRARELVPSSAVPHVSLRAVVEAMEHRCHHDWKLAELAKLAGMSTSTFQRTFKASLDCSPMTYLTNVRVRRAQHWLRTGASVSQAAHVTGFASVSHFSEAFRRVVRLSPVQYRNRHLVSQ
jgi:AraC-like DNA-binding protein